MNSLAFLAQEAPGFAVRGSQVRIITEPSTFYSELCKRSLEAKKRITLSALYLGTGPKEKKLVDSIKENLLSNPDLKVKILLDFCRGTRVSSGESSCTLLRTLPMNSTQISLYHTPVLRGLKKKLLPPKYNETLGLQHCKVYVFDDSLILSGANLSHDYFTNRQDRYVLVESCPKLADYFDNLVSTISDFSLHLNEKNGCDQSQTCLNHPYESGYHDFRKEVKSKVMSFLAKEKEQNLLTFDSVKQSFMSSSVLNSPPDTWIFPTVQMGLFGIDQDREVTEKMLQAGDSESAYKFATGYFNPTPEYLHTILHNSKSKYDLFMAHPSANGFYGTKFPMSGIPHAYTLIARRFQDLVHRNDAEERIRLYEYKRPGWTFHAKGLWFYPSASDLPTATMIGSPNFGFRSVEKDLEAQITIVTMDSQLQSALHAEQKNISDHSVTANRDTFEQPERQVPNWVKLVVAFARNFF